MVKYNICGGRELILIVSSICIKHLDENDATLYCTYIHIYITLIQVYQKTASMKKDNACTLTPSHYYIYMNEGFYWRRRIQPDVSPAVQCGLVIGYKRGLQVRDNGRFHIVYSCQVQQLPSHHEWFALETVQSVLKQRSQLQRETAGIELTLPRHMWIMDHFHSNSQCVCAS